MAINGISNPLAGLGSVARPETARVNPDRTAPANANRPEAPIRGSGLKAQTPIAGQATAQQTVPVEAPAGTDPSLWSVLTSEERNFFAKSAATGPLTYSRIKDVTNPPAAPIARGVRLDVRA
jgi:hypothetical protein